MYEWLTIREAAFRVGRSQTTVRGWIHLPGVVKEKRGKTWYLRSDCVADILSKYSRRSRTVRRLAGENEIASQICPFCQGSDWRRDGYSDLVSGEVSIVLRCESGACGRRWSLRLPKDAEVNDQRKKGEGRSHRAGMGDPAVSDTKERVLADRRSYIEGYVRRGLSLWRVLEVFGQPLKEEVTEYYYQLKGKMD